MPARDNRFRENAFRSSQEGDFDFQAGDFLGAYGREARIVQRRVNRRPGDNVGERAGILDLPHAAAQRSTTV
jgi:hypothetical protein